MQRVARWLPFALLLSCGPTEQRPMPVGMQVSIPQITLDRLDDQLHLRIFSKGSYTCDPMTGHILNNGTRVADYGGGNVNPVVRCDPAMWNTMRQAVGETQPVDICFPKSAPAMVDVPPGNYIVLVEGSGVSTDGSGRRIILGSGCGDLEAMPGTSPSVNIVMNEQADVGVCGDHDVAANESCDEGAESPTCDHCQFPERQVNTTATTAVKNPSIAWAVGQNMLIAFESNDDPYLHQLSPAGAPLTQPAAFANDNILDATARNEQHFVRLAATASGYAATWETLERASDFDIEGSVSDYNGPPPPPADAFVNPTSMTTGQDRLRPAVAVSGSRAVFVYQSGPMGSEEIRVAATNATPPIAAPSADAALVASGGMGATAAITPQIAATSSGFVVAWAARSADFDIYAARLDSNGAPMGMPIRVNTESAGNQDQPAIAANGSDVVIAWRDASMSDPADTMGTTVRWRHFDTSLTPDGNDRVAPTTTAGDQLAPTVAVASNGVVLVAWEDAGGAIRGRLVRANGSTVVNRVNASTGDFDVSASAGATAVGMGPRHAPAAAFGGTAAVGGNALFGVTWQDQGLNQIRVRTFRAD
jgi:hypothetical protein